MATVFLNKGDANAAVASGQYRRQPIAKVVATAEPSEEVPKAPPKPGSINVNSATLTELTAINGIGVGRGKELIEKRPYNSAEDLIAVTEAVNWLELAERGEIWFG